ncbi:hypothetical protein ACWCYY_10895 [Kitasatospora sp. NPDC001664]
MSDAPTVVEVTTAAPPPNAPATAAPAPAGQSFPGMPLAVAAANAAAGLASGAVVAGPLPLAAAGAAATAAAGIAALRRRTGRSRHGTLPFGAGHRARHAAGTALRGGGSYGPTSAGRRAAGYGSVPAQSSRHSNAPGRSTAVFEQGTTTSHRPQSRTGVANSGYGPAGSTRRERPGRSGHRLSGRNPAGGIVSWGSDRQASPVSSSGSRPHRAASSGAGRLTGDRGGRERAELRQQKRAARQQARLNKGLARAERRAGITPANASGGRAGRTSRQAPIAGGLTADQHKRLKRSAARYRARMAGAVLATAGVGALSALVGNWRHRGMVSSHMRRTWGRLSSRARAARERRDAAILGGGTDAPGTPAGAAAVPVPAENVNWPAAHRPTGSDQPGAVPGATGAATSPITLGKSTVKEFTVSDQQSGSTVPAFSLSSAADVLLQAAATFDPEQMTEFEQLITDLPVAYGALQEALRVLTELAMERLPVEPVVVEEIGEGYRAMSKVVQALEEVAPTYRRAHQVDIDRTENPRNGLEAERKWNV